MNSVRVEAMLKSSCSAEPLLAPLFALCLLVSPVLGESLRAPQEVFPPGERLIYEVRWHPPAWMFFFPTVTAGELVFQVSDSSPTAANPVLRITVDAVSSGFLPKVAGISVKDRFESVIDATDFCSLGLTKWLREGNRQRDIYLTFDRGKRTGRYLAYDVGQNPRVELKNQEAENLPACVQDLVSAIYHSRLLTLEMGREYPLTIADDGVVKEVLLRVAGLERVGSAAGSFSALRVEALSVFGGLFRQGGSLVVWLSDDGKRIPVCFEAKVKLGKVFGSIKKVGCVVGIEPRTTRLHIQK